jgi:hypothetical protein
MNHSRKVEGWGENLFTANNVTHKRLPNLSDGLLSDFLEITVAIASKWLKKRQY